MTRIVVLVGSLLLAGFSAYAQTAIDGEATMGKPLTTAIPVKPFRQIDDAGMIRLAVVLGANGLSWSPDVWLGAALSGATVIEIHNTSSTASQLSDIILHTGNSDSSHTSIFELRAADSSGTVSYGALYGTNFSGLKLGGVTPPQSFLHITKGMSGNTDLVKLEDTNANDNLVGLMFAGVSGPTAALRAKYTNPSSSTETELRFYTNPAGGNNNLTQKMVIGNGVVVGNPVGGDKGAGTVNASELYDDGVLLTDWVLTPNGSPDKLAPYRRLFGLNETLQITQDEHRLPWMPKANEFEKERHVGGMVTRLYQGQEQQQLYIFELEQRLARLEAQLKQLTQERTQPK